MKKLFIVDASGYLYSSYYAIRNMSNNNGESTNALFGFVRAILKLIKDFEPTHLVVVFDGLNNGKKRKEIFPEYKAHRKEAPQDLPYQIKWAHEFCELAHIPHLSIPYVEADDTMGSIAKFAKDQGMASYLCTSDKDMAQLVDETTFMVYTRKDNQIITPKEVKEIYGIPPSQMIDFLAIMGDASDNIPGIPGIGEKTAVTLLKQFGSLDELLAHPEKIAGEKKRLVIETHKDIALLSRRLVTIDLGVEIPKEINFYDLKAIDSSLLKNFYSKMNFHSLIKESEPIKPVIVGNYKVIETENQLIDLIENLKNQSNIAFKIEATSDHPLTAEIVGLAFAVSSHEAWYIPMEGHLSLSQILKAIIPLFQNKEIGFFSHDVKRDIHLLQPYGLEIAHIAFDTQLASYTLNSHHKQHSLEALALDYFGKIISPMSEILGKGKKEISLKEVPLERLSLKACESADTIYSLYEILKQNIKERSLENLLYNLELPLIQVLAKMEREGIFLDRDALKVTSRLIREQLTEIEEKIYPMAGEKFNINSSKQLALILQNNLSIVLPKKIATGYSTNADVLEELVDKHPIAAVILEYRSLEKLRSTYLDTLEDLINKKTHRIHCTFNQSATSTGRLSCQDPNLQNIPVRTEIGRKIRQAFRPEKAGWSYLSADYSQIELRLLAHFSGDENLINAFKNQEDIHATTAALVFDVPKEKVTKEQRYQAKAVNFGIIYGQQAFGLSKELHVDVKTAATFIETYYNRFSRVKAYIEECKAAVKKTGKAVTFIGRERLIPEINSKNQILKNLAERLAVNTPLQGTAADLIKLAMLKIDEHLSSLSLKGFMILQIHDELIFEVPDNELDQFSLFVKDIMEGVFQLKVPLIVDITIGKNWKEC